MKNKTFMKQGGFTLIEVALVVVITGMIISGLIIPSGALLTDDAYNNEERNMENIKHAIIGYTAQNSTARNIVDVSENSGNTRRFTLPEGRPYLPCPDITGDGYEDRVLYDETGMIAPPSAITITLDRAAGTANEIISRGSCASTRGVLPWRTLGVPPSDVWGNLYTYQVDAIFSDAMVGFNQNSIIDEFDMRTQIANNLRDAYERRATVALTITRSAVNIITMNEMRPPVICTNGPSGEVCSNSATLTIRLLDSKQGGPYDLLFRSYLTNDITEGVPFVVVSHGKNGHGAVNYANNFFNKYLEGTSTTPPSGAVAPQGLICNWPANTTLTVLLNAEAINFPQPNVPDGNDTVCNDNIFNLGDPIRNGFIFYRPRGQSEEFDDSIMWLQRNELIDIMTRSNVLPAPDFPALRPY